MPSLLPVLAHAAVLTSPATEAPPARSDQQARDECLSHAFDPYAEDKCYDSYQEALEVRLAHSVRSARSHMAENEREAITPDSRRDPGLLDRSQKTWRAFAEADCAVQGGLLGGLNVWVSRYERECFIDALEKRIADLDSLASGEFEKKKMIG